MEKLFTTIESPTGEILLTGHVVHASGTRGEGELALSALMWNACAHAEGRTDKAREDKKAFGDVIRQLEEYFAGKRTIFDVRLDPTGTPFQHRVWAELRKIPFGETTTYGTIARTLGKPSASRAVGAANGKNPIGIIVPCHRVIGESGALTGFAGGLDAKRTLLGLEARVSSRQLALTA